MRNRFFGPLVATIVIYAGIAFGAVPKWVKVQDIHQPIAGTSIYVDATSYLDTANVTEQDGIRSVEHRLVRAQPTMAPGRVMIKEYHESLKIDCVKKSIALARVGFISPQGIELGHRSTSAEKLSFVQVPPDSQKGILIKAACEAKVTAAPEISPTKDGRPAAASQGG